LENLLRICIDEEDFGTLDDYDIFGKALTIEMVIA